MRHLNPHIMTNCWSHNFTQSLIKILKTNLGGFLYFWLCHDCAQLWNWRRNFESTIITSWKVKVCKINSFIALWSASMRKSNMAQSWKLKQVRYHWRDGRRSLWTKPGLVHCGNLWFYNKAKTVGYKAKIYSIMIDKTTVFHSQLASHAL